MSAASANTVLLAFALEVPPARFPDVSVPALDTVVLWLRSSIAAASRLTKLMAMPSFMIALTKAYLAAGGSRSWALVATIAGAFARTARPLPRDCDGHSTRRLIGK